MKKLILLLFMFTSLAAQSQVSDKWKLCINKKRIGAGTHDKPGSVVISPSAKGVFIIRYSGTGKNDKKRSMIIFDTERHELIRKDIAHNFGKFTISMEVLKSKTNGKSFQIYTVAIPKNPEEAALVRMAPMLLCDVAWGGK